MTRTVSSQIVAPIVLAIAALVFSSASAEAQDGATRDDGDDELVEIIVTGSRIPRDEFSSPSPIQVLDVEEGRKIGVTSVAELLRRSPVVTGLQIDETLNTSAFTNNATEEPPPGGVGSSNISLRGLEPERTLVLLNGRRLGSGGVRGAPSQPDVSLIPFALVDRVEVLTEGASAVYGADAVAGVMNVILRDEFEGLEVIGGAGIPGEPGGETQQLSILAGVQGDRGSIQLAAEFFDRARVTTGDRDFAICGRDIEQLEDGRIESVCRQGLPENVAIDANFNFVFFTLGQTDIGIPNWSSFNALPPPDHPLVQDPGTRRRLHFVDFYNLQDEARAADLVGEIERFSAVTSGKLYLDAWQNGEIYFESLYLNSRVFSKAGAEQIFPDVLGQIPQEDANGNIIVDTNGAPILVDNPLNPFPIDVVPVLSLESIPQHRDVEREQSRLVLGLRGDVGNSTWSWDAFVSYDRGIGFQAQPILFEPHLELSLFTLRLDANGNPICGLRNPSSTGFGFTTPEECVPLDITNTDLYVGGPTGEGVFTAAEEAYLVGNRTNRTVVEQTMFSAFATGELFTIGGDRDGSAAFGAEYRIDEIDSQNDITGVQGLNAAESPLQEGSTIGERYIFEAFAEVNLPLLDSLELDAAVRFTDEENFGSELTWRGRLAWSPMDYLTVSGSAGTSYRAPNLREQFLAGQGGGVSASLDPCGFVQVLLFIQGAGGDMDPRAINLTNNCALAGAQMVDLDGNGFLDTAFLGTGATIPTATSGSALLLPETSESYTATVKISQPWSDSFDLDLAISYWDIVIENTVEEQSAGELLEACYTDLDFPDLSSPFCSRHTRLMRPDGFAGQVNFVDISFVNIGEQTAKGIDLNTRFLYSFSGAGLDLVWLTASTLMLEQERQIFSVADRDDNLGEIGTPKLRFNSTVSLLRSNWEFMMQNRYIGDAASDVLQDFQDFTPSFFAPLLSRPVTWVDSIWYTDISLTYGRDLYSITAGVRNLFDESPPLISFGGPNRNNAVTSSGYDLIGRTFFISAKLGF